MPSYKASANSYGQQSYVHAAHSYYIQPCTPRSDYTHYHVQRLVTTYTRE